MKEFWDNFLKNIKIVVEDLKSKDRKRIKRQIPNVLTLVRGVIAPITIIPAVIAGNIYLAFIMIAICSLTDAFDGWYARKYNVQSEFGALLDTICDKLFILTLSFPLVFVYTKWIILILVLELIISIINSLSQLRGKEVHSSVIGKIKTFVLDIAIALCYFDYIVKISKVVLNVASICTNVLQVICVYGYYKNYKRQIQMN